MTSELRQLRRVRWGVRLTLALGISASLAANILHAHHILIDQVIAGWPPVAVFATIEAIARVPIRSRWLAAIRMTGLGFVAGIAFWVSYWHMASVAAQHGENGSKYLLPLSVDGLVVVASISLVELTGQISAVETATRAATAPPPAPRPVAAPAPLPGGGPGAAVPPPDQPPHRRSAIAAVPLATATVDAGDEGEPGGVDMPPPADRVVVGRAPRSVSAATAAHTIATAAHRDRDVRHVDALRADTPPESPHEAIAWWHSKDPALTVTQIAAQVGRSERTVRRILDTASAASQRSAAHPSGGGPTDPAAVEELAETGASPT